MSKFGDVLKNGWHPEKGASLKGQVKGLVGRGEDSKDERKDHVSRPLHTLTDPSSLPPPPQRRGTGLAPVPVSSSGGDKRKVVTAPSKYQDPHGPRVEPPARITREPPEGQEQIEEATPQPPRPYRTNTTGLQTDHLPPPPGRRDGANVRSPPSYGAATNTTGVARAVPALPGRGGGAGAAPPSLPPRLPPRGAATPPSSSPQSTGTGGGGLLNQGAVNRLGAAGVSVPGLGIGKSNAGSSNAGQQQQQGGNHMNELQGRFARFNTSTNPQQEQQEQAGAATPATSQGTTWAQKQAALKTASQFHKDPSQVSFADAKAAAGTANNFRQRHGEQVAAGYGKAQRLNQKYGVADKVGGFASKFGGGVGGGGGAQEQQQQQETGVVAAVAKKKPPPPPPPKKKPGLAAAAAAAPPAAEEDAPPPIPMSTRPAF
ncbi:hypothetical protein LEL_05207 [Akanthomyces lecanii RCEF 1005]|uniref:GMP synthase n=1 Tax=Akanthomyces lecanii RCEF 1005 TaxID=1081108 RepID=A0A168HWP9_CORDF|nr:hypothetical protein LEL_05207 [Akanthomyces lecanii RCEF 1005]